jgi:TM2 domain-containing membrane protein YozV
MAKQPSVDIFFSKETFLWLVILIGSWLILSPVVQWLDSPELVLSSTHLGIAHPPGQPFFVSFTHWFKLLPICTAPLRLSLIGSLCLPLSLLLLMKTCFSRQAWNERFIIIVALLAFSRAMQLNIVRQELYLLQFCCFSFASYLYCRSLEHSADAKDFLLLCFVAGLAFANHTLLTMTTIVPFIALLAPIYLRRQSWQVPIWGIFFGLLGVSLYLWLPIRGMKEAAINFAIPTHWTSFWWVVTGKLYQSYDAPTWLQLKQNLSWVLALYMDFLTPIGFLVSLLGWWAFYRQERPRAVVFLLIVIANLFSVLPSSNFYVHNPDVLGYLLPGLVLFFLVGLGGALRWSQEHLTFLPAWAMTVILLIAVVAQYFFSTQKLWSYLHPESDRFVAAVVDELPYRSTIGCTSYHTYALLRQASYQENYRSDLKVDYLGDPATQQQLSLYNFYEPILHPTGLRTMQAIESPELPSTERGPY